MASGGTSWCAPAYPATKPVTAPAASSRPITVQNLRRRPCSRSSPSPLSITAPIVEEFLDPQVDQPRHSEREGKRRIMLARLDRVDRLARHADPAAKLRLAPAAFSAKDTQSIFHLFLLESL